MLTIPERDIALRLARHALERGVQDGRPVRVPLNDLPSALIRPAACFVTLEIGGALRGCVGSLEPTRTLAEDIAHNAWAAATRDTRFDPVSPEELNRIELHLSILGPLQPIAAESESELAATLRPRVDGLVIESAGRRATFLPSVWDHFPDAVRFLGALKRKAGIGDAPLVSGFRAWRYAVESIP